MNHMNEPCTFELSVWLAKVALRSQRQQALPSGCSGVLSNTSNILEFSPLAEVRFGPLSLPLADDTNEQASEF